MMQKRRVLIAVNDARFSRELVELGTIICKQIKGELCLLYVYEVPMALPLEDDSSEEIAKGDRILSWGAEIAEERQVDVRTDIVNSRTASAGIVSEAKDLNAELIIMGMKPYPGLGITFKSDTVKYVLKKAHCRVIVVKQEIGE